MNFIGIIPARFGSTRFPGKPLVDIGGKTMIQRVYEQGMKANSFDFVCVATDDERIHSHILSIGGKAIMTSTDTPTGTERCLEAYKSDLAYNYLADETVIVNIQGDEPFIDPAQLDALCSCFSDEKVEIATLTKKIEHSDEVTNSNVVKLVKSNNGKALYFSRHPIPFVREYEPSDWMIHSDFYKHIGIYAYRANVLAKIASLAKSSLEKAENLEQLRWLENGFHIQVLETTIESISIDTPEDLSKLILK